MDLLIYQRVIGCLIVLDLPAGDDGPQSALEEELLGADAPPEQVIRRLLQVCGQLEQERDAAEEALKKGRLRSDFLQSTPPAK